MKRLMVEGYDKWGNHVQRRIVINDGEMSVLVPRRGSLRKDSVPYRKFMQSLEFGYIIEKEAA